MIAGLAATPAEGRICTPSDPSVPCNIASGAYFIETPDIEGPHARYPAVLILHDAGQSPASLIDDRELVDALISRGVAVIAPYATRRGIVRATISLSPARDRFVDPFGRILDMSEQRYVVETADGGEREFRVERDRGWYFHNVDIEADRRASPPRLRRPGRDETAFVRDVILDAKRRFWVDDGRVAIVGLGHGGSLVWEIACRAPDLARVLAPVGGAHWLEVPERCVQGARLVHTHSLKSRFWPMAGVRGTGKRFRRTAILDNISRLVVDNACRIDDRRERLEALGATRRSWPGCGFGASVELIQMDDAFAFQGWWLNDLVNRLDAGADEPEARDVPLADPKFATPKGTERTDAPDLPRVRSPGTAGDEETPTSTRFKRAPTGTDG